MPFRPFLASSLVMWSLLQACTSRTAPPPEETDQQQATRLRAVARIFERKNRWKPIISGNTGYYFDLDDHSLQYAKGHDLRLVRLFEKDGTPIRLSSDSIKFSRPTRMPDSTVLVWSYWPFEPGKWLLSGDSAIRIGYPNKGKSESSLIEYIDSI